jgi:Divergent InlB B-repeat domain
MTEAAEFKVRPLGPPLTYTLTVAETGLPTGVAWAVSFGATGASGTGPALTVAGLNGTAPFVVPPVLTAPGTRFVSNLTGIAETVTGNRSIALIFTEQFELVVTGSQGGSVSPSSEWLAPGASITLHATPNATSVFANWTGTGMGAYSGTTSAPTLTVSGPVNELATFTPRPAPATAAGTTTGLPSWFGWGLFAALLAAGSAGGLAFGRRQRPPAAEETEPESAPEGGSDGSTAHEVFESTSDP